MTVGVAQPGAVTVRSPLLERSFQPEASQPRNNLFSRPDSEIVRNILGKLKNLNNNAAFFSTYESRFPLY